MAVHNTRTPRDVVRRQNACRSRHASSALALVTRNFWRPRRQKRTFRDRERSDRRKAETEFLFVPHSKNMEDRGRHKWNPIVRQWERQKWNFRLSSSLHVGRRNCGSCDSVTASIMPSTPSCHCACGTSMSVWAARMSRGPRLAVITSGGQLLTSRVNKVMFTSLISPVLISHQCYCLHVQLLLDLTRWLTHYRCPE